jgi:N6-L-threonylcarbamoyladenine synthase
LGLGYPGGPIISDLAQKFREKETGSAGQENDRIVFPRPIINDGTFNFSLSGLKTAVLVWIKKYLLKHQISSAEELGTEIKEEIAFAFEEAVADVLCAKVLKAIKQYKPKIVLFAGGVSANSYLQKRLKEVTQSFEIRPKFFVPGKNLFGDNAAMIGIAAFYHRKKGETKTWHEIKVDSNLELEQIR